MSTTSFADNLKQLPPITHLSMLELIDEEGQIAARIENKPGSQGSLALYAFLADKHGAINTAAAQEGLALYAEHTADAEQNPGKHPNIDRLIDIVARNASLSVRLTP